MKQNRMLRLVVITLLSLVAIGNANAQRYISDHLFADSIQVREVRISKTDTVTLDAKTSIPNGEPLEYRGESKDIYRVFMEHDGKLYSVHREDVKFSDDNEPGVANVVQKEEQAHRHTEIGHFFHTMKPYYLIIIIMVITWLMSWIMNRLGLPRALFGLFMFVIPIGLLAVAVLEGATFAWCKDFLWWIDQDKLGFWKTALLVLPVIVTVLLQINVGMDYKAAVEDWCGEDLRWRPAFIGVAVSVPLGIAAAIVSAVAHWGSTAETLGMAIGFFGSLGIAFLICMGRNCKALGFFMGLAFTLFSFVYAAGVVIAVGLAIVVLFRLTLTALMWLIPGVMLLAASGGSVSSSSSSSSNKTPKSSFARFVEREQWKKKEREKRQNNG